MLNPGLGKEIAAHRPSADTGGSYAARDHFRDLLRVHYGAHEVSGGAHVAFRGRLEIRDFGPLQVGIASGNEVHWRRSKDRLDESWHDRAFIVQQFSGRTEITHYEQHIGLRPRDLMIIDSLGECSYRLADDGCLVCFDVPRTFFDAETFASRRWLRRIDGSQGAGRVLSATLSSLAQPAEAFGTDDDVLMLDIVQTLVERTLRSDDSRPVCNGLLSRLRRWVLAHLDMPEITPAIMAQACNISRRQLYRLFGETGTTPAAWLWQVRLEQAHDLLLRYPARAIIDIAFDVGFNEASHFSRAFKAHFGVSPRTARCNACCALPGKNT